MDTTLRVLLVEDSLSDAGLIVRHLERGGYVPVHERVQTAAGMKAAMEKEEWDIVIADYHMPQFDGLAALKLVHESGRDLPFIVVSGSMGEDTAVAMMKAGAHDYVMKNDLTRLIPAVQRELGDAEVRRSRRLAEEALQQSEERYRALYEDNPSMYFTTDAEGTALSVKPLSEDTAVFCFRAVQELLVNVVKHARARKVGVSSGRDGDCICIMVEDDGIGFDTTEALSRPGGKKGFGLFSIRERLQHLRGSLKIDSKPGEGTRVTLSAALEHDQNGRC